MKQVAAQARVYFVKRTKGVDEALLSRIEGIELIPPERPDILGPMNQKLLLLAGGCSCDPPALLKYTFSHLVEWFRKCAALIELGDWNSVGS